MNQLGDREIEQSIRRFINNDPRIDSSEVDINVQDGVVYLSGRVDSAAERRAAQEDIRASTEVRGIVDQLSVRNFIERTDDELKEAVRHALIRDISVDAEPITVEAHQGNVTLSGRVESYSQKTAAEDVAWWTPGVMEVTSHLEVEDSSQMPEDMKG